MGRSLAYEPRNALNAICPYFTMFPLEYPLKVLHQHKKNTPVIMDPFCGRGTTLFAARSLGLKARGIDSSPVAVANAQAKLANIDNEAVLSLARNFIEEYDNPEIPSSEFFRQAFHRSTLKQICSIRDGLNDLKRSSNASVALKAAMLGCLHGPINKNIRSLSYFSNQMPRTFAPKPDYAVNYWKERNLSPPKVNVSQILLKKLNRIQEVPISDGMRFTHAKLGDSRFASSIPTSLRDFSIVITSPPYYGMRTYVEDQWVRNWFLGGPSQVIYGNKEQLEHSGEQSFVESLGKVWKNMARTKSDSLRMYIRFGIIPSMKADPIKLFKESLDSSEEHWKLISTRQAASADSGKRQANLMATSSKAALEYDFHVVRI